MRMRPGKPKGPGRPKAPAKPASVNTEPPENAHQSAVREQHYEPAHGERPGPGNPPKPVPKLPRKVPADQGPHK